MTTEPAYVNWSVDVLASTLLTAAKKKVEFHQARLDHWQARRGEVEKDLKEKGVSFRHNDARYSNTYAGMGQLDVAIDPTLLRLMQDVEGKIQTHAGKVREFQRWVAFLERTNKSLKCDAATFELFGIGEQWETAEDDEGLS